MSDSSGSSFVPPRDSRLTPEAIAERGFSQVKRGYAESEVRAFLRMAADEVATLGGRERELANRVRSLEDRLSAPRPVPSDQDLITALGEETARVLGQARESAVELRAKAEEHARRVVREAQESARVLRSSTQQAVDTKTREAEDVARARAKEIVGEARSLRERVLSDLTDRRQQLEQQINDLRANRSRLVEAYQAVERALAQATRVMADEPAAPAPSASRPPEPPAAEVPAPEVPAAASVALAAEDRATDVAEAPPPSITSPPDVRDADEPSRPGAATGDTRDVGALFEQLRSEQAPTPGAVPDAAAAAPEAAGEPTAEPAAESEAPSDASDASDDPDAEPPLEGNAALLRARDDALAPVADDVARRAKRTLQDEQNDVLDGLRRQRGKIDMEKILPAADEQLTRWAHVLQPAVDRAYAAGAASVASAGGGADAAAASVSAALLAELAGVTVTPLRERLESSLATVDTRSPADMEIAVAQALGARYREWRAQDLEMALGDVLTVAYARGVHDAAPEGSQLRWIPAREGKCPDCDDNALEPTARGSTFPTGQAYPPAHPGCRCLLVLDAHT